MNSFGQSPFEFTEKQIDIYFSNVSDLRGPGFVKVTNIDTVTHDLRWLSGNENEMVEVEIVDKWLHYASHVTTSCDLGSFIGHMDPGDTGEFGIYNMRIDNIETFDFPYKFPLYIVERDSCDSRIDSISINVKRANPEDYDFHFDRDTITLVLDDGTGVIEVPHEELNMVNNTDFAIGVRWRLNDEELPDDLRFRFRLDISVLSSYSLGTHHICDIEEDFVLNRKMDSTSYSAPFKIVESKALNISEWEFSSYETTVDLLLLGCDTILDSFVLKIQRGTTSSIAHIDSEQIIIAPNPVSDLLMIKSENHLSHIEIYSLSGERLLTENNSEIDVSDLSEGLYLLKAKTDDNRTVLKRFLKID